MTSRTMRIALTVILVMCGPPRPAWAAEDPLRLELKLGVQADRLNSALADSLGLSLTHTTVTELAYDFRVFSVPMAGEEKPALHVVGNALLGKRAMPVSEFTGPGFGGAPIQAIRVGEVTLGLFFTLPMTLVDPGAGSRLRFGYRGGLLLTGGARNDFPHVKQFVFGFERTRGFFEGSAFEMAYGTNEAAGREFGAHRWGARALFMGQLNARDKPVPGKPAPGKPAAPARPATSTVHLFLELNVDSDGSIGPDLLMARVGVTLDAGRIAAGVLGSVR